jgi:hypothetical protein
MTAVLTQLSLVGIQFDPELYSNPDWRSITGGSSAPPVGCAPWVAAPLEASTTQASSIRRRSPALCSTTYIDADQAKSACVSVL